MTENETFQAAIEENEEVEKWRENKRRGITQKEIPQKIPHPKCYMVSIKILDFYFYIQYLTCSNAHTYNKIQYINIKNNNKL